MSASNDDPAIRPPHGLRCRQAGVRPEGLDRAIALFETRLSDLPPYGPHLRWWIARYSRGDDLALLREDFADVIDAVDRDGETAQERGGNAVRLFAYGQGFIGRYRHALVMLSISLCLRRPDCARRLLRWCERGDALIETVVQANGAPRAGSYVPPPFPERFDGLYAAVEAASPAAAAGALSRYLSVWADDRMKDMGFKISEKGICYWCFEAAGIVAALGIDDSSFAAEPVYPADLVACYRERA